MLGWEGMLHLANITAALRQVWDGEALIRSLEIAQDQPDRMRISLQIGEPARGCFRLEYDRTVLKIEVPCGDAYAGLGDLVPLPEISGADFCRMPYLLHSFRAVKAYLEENPSGPLMDELKQALTYKDLYAAFVRAVPESAAYLSARETENELSQDDGIYILFGLAVIPYALEMVRQKESETVQKIFAFFEKMACTDDLAVVEVLEVEVVESIVTSGREMLEACKTHMGPETLDTCLHIERFFDV